MIEDSNIDETSEKEKKARKRLEKSPLKDFILDKKDIKEEILLPGPPSVVEENVEDI